jgi:hypothetical protein
METDLIVQKTRESVEMGDKTARCWWRLLFPARYNMSWDKSVQKGAPFSPDKERPVE